MALDPLPNPDLLPAERPPRADESTLPHDARGAAVAVFVWAALMPVAEALVGRYGHQLADWIRRSQRRRGR